jgi:hypothetical protein
MHRPPPIPPKTQYGTTNDYESPESNEKMKVAAGL